MSIRRPAAHPSSAGARRAATRHENATARSSATPTGFAIGAGSVGLVVAAMIAAAIPVADADWRFAVMAISVGSFAAISLDQLALGGIVVLAFLISNGFLEDRLGQLAWHGSGDLWRLLLLVTAGAVGLGVGEGVRLMAKLRARGRADTDRADDEAYRAEAPADEMSRWVWLGTPADEPPGWVTDLASAADLAGWTGPRPINPGPDESGQLGDRLHLDGRSNRDEQAPSGG